MLVWCGGGRQAAVVADQAFAALVAALGGVPVVVIARQAVLGQVGERVGFVPVENGMHLVEAVLERPRRCRLTFRDLVTHDAAQPEARLQLGKGAVERFVLDLAQHQGEVRGGGIAPASVVALDVARCEGAAIGAQVEALVAKVRDQGVGRAAVEAVIDKDQREVFADHGSHQMRHQRRGLTAGGGEQQPTRRLLMGLADQRLGLFQCRGLAHDGAGSVAIRGGLGMGQSSASTCRCSSR